MTTVLLMPPDPPPTTSDDDLLLAALGEVLRERDPVPDDVLEAARSALVAQDAPEPARARPGTRPDH